jgi:hypothetical protein
LVFYHTSHVEQPAASLQQQQQQQGLKGCNNMHVKEPYT